MSLSALLVGTLGVGVLALIVFLCGFVAPYWTWHTVSGVDTHTGLWQWCRVSVSSSKDLCGILVGDGQWPGGLSG